MTGLSEVDFKNLLAQTVKEAVKAEVVNLLSNGSSQQKEYLTAKETTGVLGVSLTTLNAWEKAKILSPVRIGTRVRYRYEDIIGVLSKGRRSA